MTQPMSTLICKHLLGAGLSCLMFAFLMVPTGAPASTFRHLSVTDLATHSDAVLRGFVLETKARYASDESGRILTDVHVSVAESIQGSPAGPVVVFTVLGGEIGDKGQKVHGMPSFSPGEEVVLFLQQAPSRNLTFSLVGLSQGAFFVRRGHPASLPQVFRRIDGTRFIGNPGAPLPRNLPDLLDQVRSARPLGSHEVAP